MLYARQDVWLIVPMTKHAEPYQQYERPLIGVAVLSTFKHYRTRALYHITHTALKEFQNIHGARSEQSQGLEVTVH